MSDPTSSSPDFAGARDYALNRLEQELPSTLLYHSLWHTRDEVAVRAQWLAKHEGLSAKMQGLIATAAYLHDIGFIVQRIDHERMSARIAADTLPHFGFLPRDIAMIQGMILATRLPQTPRNIVEEVIADADLDVLGRNDFFVRNRALRDELAQAGIVTSDEEWYAQQVQFLARHHYFTEIARRQRVQTKLRNLERLHDMIKDRSTQVHEGPIAIARPMFAVP